MLTVHHLENSRSQRILWLLEELGVPYEIRHYKRDPKTMLAPAALRAVHPLGKSPVVTDDGVTVAESGAIIEYVLEQYGNGRLEPKPGTPERRRYGYWMHYAEGTLMPYLVMRLIFNRLKTVAPFLVRPVVKGLVAQVNAAFLGPNLKSNLDFVEAELAKSTWLAGEELTAADVQMSFPLEAAMARATDGTARPRIQAYLERVHARPAYQRALQKGGPLQILG